jgi:carboxylesterase
MGGLAYAARLRRSRRFEREVDGRLPRSHDGVVIGGGPVHLDAGTRGVLLLHGFGDTPQSMRALAGYLHTLGWTVRAPLLPGHGRTLEEFARSGASEWVSAAQRAYDDLRRRCPRTVLIGQSLGGALALIVARRDPALPAMVLIAPYLTMLPRVAGLARWYWLARWATVYVRSRNEASIHDAHARAQSLGCGVTPVRLLPELRAVLRGAWDAAPDVATPTLVIQSRHDNRIRAADAERAFHRLGAMPKELHWVEAGGHVLSVDVGRERVFADAASWLERFVPAEADGSSARRQST